jgi:putative transposase
VAFKLRPRSRKYAHQESIVILAKHYKKKRGMFSFIRRMRSAERLPDDIVYDSRLVLERRTGAWYLCLLSPLCVQPENQGPRERRVVALDPGVRTFMTGYDPVGEATEFARGDIGRIYRMCARLDALQSRWSDPGVGHHRRWRMRRAAARMRTRIRNLVDDVHRKLAKYLCSTYNAVLLPKFETSSMVTRGQRRISSKTARAMATWSHYRFRTRLQAKAREYPWCKVVMVDEAYTSKTCGACGAINRSLGASKVFRCPACGLHADRDVHAARNILLRFLADTDRPTFESGDQASP